MYKVAVANCVQKNSITEGEQYIYLAVSKKKSKFEVIKWSDGEKSQQYCFHSVNYYVKIPLEFTAATPQTARAITHLVAWHWTPTIFKSKANWLGRGYNSLVFIQAWNSLCNKSFYY